MKNVFLSQYFLSQYREQKCLVCNDPQKENCRIRKEGKKVAKISTINFLVKKEKREIKKNEAPEDVFHKLSGNPEANKSKKEKQKKSERYNLEKNDKCRKH